MVQWHRACSGGRTVVRGPSKNPGKNPLLSAVTGCKDSSDPNSPLHYTRAGHRGSTNAIHQGRRGNGGCVRRTPGWQRAGRRRPVDASRYAVTAPRPPHHTSPTHSCSLIILYPPTNLTPSPTHSQPHYPPYSHYPHQHTTQSLAHSRPRL